MSDEKRDYSLFIDDILEAIEKVERYITGRTYEDFSGNEMAVDAVIRNFEVIGEAAKNIPEEIKKKYPDVEWKEMIGFRNVLIHEYSGIEIESVWDTLRKNIPELKKHILDMKAAYERTTDT